jgi:ribA/ribD-fused uncharacterized protein
MIPLLRRPGLVAFIAAWLALPLVAPGQPPAAAPGELKLIGMRTIPSHLAFQGTVVGGLSGLDYQAATDTWISESDDKSEFSPARFYTLRLNYDEAKFSSVEVTDVTLFRQPDGTIYPDKAHALAQGGDIPDLESVRFDPGDGSIWYTSEGDRRLGMNPFVRHAARDGRFLAELPQPAMFRVHPHEEAGPRHNLSFEGLTFAPDGRTLWLAMEAPLYQDGPVPTPAAGAFSRLTHYDRAGKILGQFAYPIDAIPVAAAPGKWNDNGVSEMLAINDHEFLLLERCGAQSADGGSHFHIRLYAVDVAGATDVSGLPALTGAAYLPAKKRLVLDFDRGGLPATDNLEGLAWGRRLANGHASLALIADDNFAPDEQTQVWVFEVLPAVAPVVVPKQDWDKAFEGVVQDEKRISGFVEGYRWLSNFHPCRVEWEGRVYGSAEAAYQSGKYPAPERDVFTGLDPDAAKKLTRTKPFDPAAWETRKERVMREIVWAKFSQNPELAAKLLATGDRILEETNWWGDTFWGVFKGEGKNVLGHLLMETRGRLAAPKP